MRAHLQARRKQRHAWSPGSATDRAPLLLMGHGGDLHTYAPGIFSRARPAVGDRTVTGPATGSRSPRSCARPLRPAEVRAGSAAGRRHKAGARRERASVGPPWWWIGRQCVGDRRHRRPVRCRIGCDRGRSDHRDIGRIDGGGPDHERHPTDRTAGRHPYHCAPTTDWSGRIRRWTRSIGPEPDHMERTSRIIAAAEDAADMRRRMGAAALELDAASDGSGQTRWRATVAARLPTQRWPERRCSSRRSTPIPVNRSCSTAQRSRPGRRRRRQHCQRLRCPSATASATTDTSTAATDATRMPIWRPDTNGCWCCHHSAADHGTRWMGHGSCSTGRRTTRRRQQRRNHLPGWQLPRRIRRQHDGSVDASARRSSRLRPRQSPCRAAHRILALTPTIHSKPLSRQP